MLARTASDVSSGLERLENAYLEWKLDGARIQAHRVGDEVAIFTRNLADISERVPEIVAAVRGFDATAIVLDGEAIALRDDARPEPFQVRDEPLRNESGRRRRRRCGRSSSTACTSTARI